MKVGSNETLEKLFGFMRECRKEKPRVTDDLLDQNGATYYYNGNDSTPFDWEVNNRTCEFFIFYEKEPKLGFMKAWICTNGDAEAFIYDEGELSGGIFKKIENFVSEEEAKTFCEWLIKTFDNQKAWDKMIEPAN